MPPTEPQRPPFPDGAAHVLIVDYAPELWHNYVDDVPKHVNVAFLQYAGEVVAFLEENPDIRTVVIQGFCLWSPQQDAPAPGHSRLLVHSVRHDAGFTGQIIVVSSLVHELDTSYLLEIGANVVMEKLAFWRASAVILSPPAT